MPDTPRIRCVYPFSQTDEAWLEARFPGVRFVFGGEDTDAWAAALDDPEVEVLWSNHPPPTLDKVPRLRWLGMASAGLDGIVALDPWRLGLTVTNGSGLHVVPMGEYVLGAVLLASERLGPRIHAHEEHRWASGEAKRALLGRRLRGRTAAIVGYGSVGREAARLLAGCGVRILALKADPTRRRDDGWTEPGTGDAAGQIPERIVGPDGLLDLVAEADYVVLSIPSTPRTRRLVDASVLAAMRPDAWLINVGRGALVDEDALVHALRERRIGGAVLDVTAEEPLPPDHPLWDAPDCLITPHLGGTGDADTLWHTTAGLMAQNLERYLAGEPLLNVTSGTAGY